MLFSPDGKLGAAKLRCCSAAVANDGAFAAVAPPQLSATGSVAPSDDSAPPAPPAALALKVLPAMLANPQLATSCRGNGYSGVSNRRVSTHTGLHPGDPNTAGVGSPAEVVDCLTHLAKYRPAYSTFACFGTDAVPK